MATGTNPFIVSDKIYPDYFCDRVQETARVMASLTNGNNVVVISPRRMGKTGLIHYCYQKPELRNKCYTFFIDILHTTNLKEFTYLLAKEVFDELLYRGRETIGFFVKTMKSINMQFGVDPLTDLPTFEVKLWDITRPRNTLSEIFQVLSRANKPCILAIEEFQQISKYSDKEVETLVRDYVNEVDNCRFIFAGSERDVLHNMFLSPDRPFYNSADLVEFENIGPEVYVPFITQLFEENYRQIEVGNVVKVYLLFGGHTYYIQKTFHEAFNITPRNRECTVEIIRMAIDRVIANNEELYREMLCNIPDRQKELLYAIAREERAKNIMTTSFIKRHRLVHRKSLQASTNKLLQANIITEKNSVYSVTDKFFALWINSMCGKAYPL